MLSALFFYLYSKHLLQTVTYLLLGLNTIST